MPIRGRRTGRTLARVLLRPRGFRQWAFGLLARPPLAEGEALWLDPCGGVHTWGMRYSIDVLFLDRAHRVLRAARHVPPWRVVPAPRGTRSVLELRSGGAAAVAAGDLLVPE